MKVYILDAHNKSLEQILSWLSENQRIKAVEVFDDYIKFLGRIEEEEPALCLIRLGREGIPGLKTARMIKALHPGIRIVFVSDERDYALDAYEIGAYGYMLCPVNKEKFDKYLITKRGEIN